MYLYVFGSFLCFNSSLSVFVSNSISLCFQLKFDNVFVSNSFDPQFASLSMEGKSPNKITIYG